MRLVLLVTKDDDTFFECYHTLPTALLAFEDYLTKTDVRQIELITAETLLVKRNTPIQQVLCQNCQKPINNLTGMFIIKSPNKQTTWEVGTCCFDTLLNYGWQHIATAK